MDIGGNIKIARRQKKMTQNDLAIKSSISRSYLADVEGNRYNPSIETLDSIAKALKVPIGNFFSDTTVKEIGNPNPIEVGLRIREIRVSLGLSMSAFAKKIDKKAKSGTVSNWETGKNLPNNERLKNIADLGDCSIDWIISGYFDKRDQHIDKLEKEIKRLKNTLASITKIIDEAQKNS